MVDRINLILKAKNLTSRQFAEEIGIQPSGMSHILSGRNRPSLDFVMKVISRYPEIDLKWLTLGEGEMYSTTAPTQKKERKTELDLFSAMEDEVEENEPSVEMVSPSQVDESITPKINDPLTEYSHPEPIPEVEQNVSPVSTNNVSEELKKEENRQQEKGQEVKLQDENRAVEVKKVCSNSEAVAPVVKQKKIAKFVVLYDDHTFAEYFPE